MNDTIHESVPAHRQPSDEAIAYFQDCRRLLGISDTWHLWLEVADAPYGNEEADGAADLEARYLKGTIIYRRNLTDARRPFVLMHEAFHVVFAPLQLAHDRVVELLPEALQTHARELLCDAEEQIIEQLTRALQAQITPPKDDAVTPSDTDKESS